MKERERMKSKPGKRRPTIGDDPLDVLVPRTDAPRPTAPTTAVKGERLPRAAPLGRRTVSAGFNLPVAVLERARDAVVFLSPLGLTMSGLVSQALQRELARLEKQHNRGRPFPKRTAAVRTGRPMTT
jgi:hypothetical protein